MRTRSVRLRRKGAGIILGVAAIVALAGCGSTLSASNATSAGDGSTNSAASLGGGSASSAGTSLGPSRSASTAGTATGAPGGGAGSPNDTTGTPSADASGSVSSVVPIPTGSASTSGIPTSGRGWTATTVSVGFTSENDFTNTAHALGYSAVDAGDQAGDIAAVVKALNNAGGLFGRKVVSVDDDNSFAQISANPTATSEGDCVFFAEDHPVVAVLNLESALDTDAFRTCMSEHQIPTMSLSVDPVDETTLSQLHGFLIPLLVPTWDALAPVLAQQLVAENYFERWDTATGGKGVAPVKIGLLIPSDPEDVAVGALIDKAFAAVGHPISDQFEYEASDAAGDMSSAVLHFRADGVTHVVEDDGGLATFAVEAQTQGYHPRYAVSSYNLPQPSLTLLASPQQLNGAVGFGTAPAIDVNFAQDPGPTPGSAYCLQVLKAGGQTFTNERFALAVALAECDGVRMLAYAANAAKGLSASSVLQGVTQAGPAFATAFAFRSGFSTSNYAVPGAGRDLAYNSGCTCFEYSGPTISLG